MSIKLCVSSRAIHSLTTLSPRQSSKEPRGEPFKTILPHCRQAFPLPAVAYSVLGCIWYQKLVPVHSRSEAIVAVKLKLIETSPAPVLIPVRGGRKSNKELGRDRKFLTPEEVERLKKVVKQNRNGTRDWLLIDTAARHGFRASELVGLKRSAINLDKGRLQVARLEEWHSVNATSRRSNHACPREAVPRCW